MSETRVRFAPSPTGYLHIGGARTCLFNWLFARKFNGKLVLRIEDTDLERLKENSIEQILRSLEWLGLEWDEGPEKGGSYGPYFQSQRFEKYRIEAARLVEEDKAYYCYCTPEELDERRKSAKGSNESFKYDGRCKNLSRQDKQRFMQEGRKPVIRIKSPIEGQTIVKDLVRGQVSFENSLLDDIIILKSNGIPTYNFACVVDDNDMKISHVIRAEEHLSNTPKQMVIYQALNYKLPEFAHVPMILAPDRSKLSKRHGATSVEEFKEQGFLAEAISNYLCLLGWSTENQEEIFNLKDIINQFSLERISKNAAIYDVKKLTWINGHYLKTLDLDYIAHLAIPFIEKAGINIADCSIERLRTIVSLIREKVWTLIDIAEGSRYFFESNFEYDSKGVEKYFNKAEVKGFLTDLIQELKQLQVFSQEAIEKVYRDYAEKTGIKAGEVIHPTRLALTGRTVSPGLFEIMEIMGRDECIDRMERAIEYMRLLAIGF